MLLRQQPDILPASLFLFALLLVANLLIGIASFMIDFDLLQSIMRTIADLVISLLFVYMLLLAFNKPKRSLQTMIALLGVSAIMNILSFPLLFMTPFSGESVGMAGLFLYLMFLWHVVIMGHIFQHAVSVSLPAGLLIAFAYILIAMSVFYSLFPVE